MEVSASSPESQTMVNAALALRLPLVIDGDLGQNPTIDAQAQQALMCSKKFKFKYVIELLYVHANPHFQGTDSAL